MNWLSKLKSKIISLSRHPKAGLWLGIYSFSEGLFFPLPTDLPLIPMCAFRTKKSLYYAFIATVFSVLGGSLAYWAGTYLMSNGLESSLYNIPGLSEENFNYFKQKFNDDGSLFVFIAAFSPLPYKLVAWASGIVRLNFIEFFIASIIGRSMRFGAIGLLFHFLGEKASIFLEKHFEKLTLLVSLLLVSGFILYKLIS